MCYCPRNENNIYFHSRFAPQGASSSFKESVATVLQNYLEISTQLYILGIFVVVLASDASLACCMCSDSRKMKHSDLKETRRELT